MSKIDLEEIGRLRNTINTNMKFAVSEYKSRSRSLNSRLSSIISQYSEYSDVTSKAREIQRTLSDIEKATTEIEKTSSKLVEGLKGVVTYIKQEEKESTSKINAIQTKLNVKAISNSNVLVKDLKQTPLDKYLNYGDLFKYNMEMQIATYKAQKEELESTKNLSEAECEEQTKALLEGLNGKVKDVQGFYDLEFKGDIQDQEVYEQAIWMFLAARGLTTAYELMEEDKLTRDRLLTYWLMLEKQGKDIKQNPVPDWWLKGKKEASEVFTVTDDNYKKIKDEALEYYCNNLYLVDVIQNDGMSVNCMHFFENWFEEQYGHLNPKSHDVKRLKYEMEQGLLVNLKNEQGLYDNEETEAFKNARDLWLNLKGVYNDYWDSKAIFTSNNKILQKLIDKIKEKGELGIKSFQHPDYEQLIIDGEYRQTKDFITKLEQSGATVVKNEDGTMTITLKTIMADGITVEDLQYGTRDIEDLPVNEYTITVDYFDYMGESYIDAKEFDKKYAEYQARRFEEGSYLNDLVGINNYSIYLDVATFRLNQLQKAYPDAEISLEQVMAMLRMEDERLALYEPKKTDSERIQDAGQFVLDLAAAAAAFAGHPYISVALEGGNAVASGTRENYDEMYLRIMGICLFGVGEYLKYADTGIELTEEALKANARKLSGLSSNEIKAVTTQGDVFTVKLQDGTEFICSRADLHADDLIKLRNVERATQIEAKYQKYICYSFEGTGKQLQDDFNKYLRENVWCDETLSNKEKIEIMKANFDKLTPEQKINFNLLADERVIKNPNYSNWGQWPDVDWPNFPGLNKETAKGVYNEVTGQFEIPTNLDRLGSSYGNNLSIVENGYHCTQNERSICYIENEFARNNYNFDTTYYKDTIDAIKDFDISNPQKSVEKINNIIDELNVKNGSSNSYITEGAIADWYRQYKSFQSNPELMKLCKEKGIDSTYGVIGEAASWEIDGKMITTGGAGQLNTPINVKGLEYIGIITNLGGW